MQGKSSSAKSEEGSSYIFLLDLSIITVLECTVFFYILSDDPLCNGGFSSLYSPSLLHLNPPCVDQIVGSDPCPISPFLKSLWATIRLNGTV